MPTYANRTDLENFFSQGNITDWADKDRDGSLSAGELQAIDAALEAAEGVVDGYLARAGYAAPFDSAGFADLPVRLQSLLKQWTVAIAGFHIYAWRGLRDRVNAMEKLYNQVLNQLQRVADGLPLAGLAREARVTAGSGTDQSAPTDDLDDVRADGWDW